ncbi:hypothetical protein V7075_26155, partial [Neobacillus drentensis]
TSGSVARLINNIEVKMTATKRKVVRETLSFASCVKLVVIALYGIFTQEYVQMNKTKIIDMYTTLPPSEAIGTGAKHKIFKIANGIAPNSIHGLYEPHFERVLSANPPTNGSNTASNNLGTSKIRPTAAALILKTSVQ